MSTPEKFDMIIIGAGAGGLSVASGAAQLGYNIALIEKGEMGGDCLNTGCVPSKALLAAAKSAQNIRASGKFGITSQEPYIDFNALKNHVFGVIDTIAPHDSQERFEGLGVRVIRETAEFINSTTIKAGEQTLTAKYIIIATGSSPSIPPIKGLDQDKVLTNENIFDLRESPEHLLIVGGGPIGIEMAQAHKRLGSQVTVLDIGPIMVKDDPELVKILRKALQSEDINIKENIEIVEIQHSANNQVSITIKENGETKAINGSHILMATGRKANINSLNLEKASINHTKQGITVDVRLRTSQKNIYAIGDVAGGPQFTHVAGYHAGIIIKSTLFKIPAKVNYATLPWVTYTDPELANVGLNEAMAREKYGDSIQITTANFKNNHRAVSERQDEGLVKIITKKNGTIIGAGIVGPHAGELITVWGLAISESLKIGAMTKIIAAYPTFNEINKNTAGSYFTPQLFSSRTKKLIKILKMLPI